MKLQYLGDSRDAFKWDLLHWLCTQARPGFSSLVFVPLLTPDDPNPTDGRTPHHWFECRPEIRGFVANLGCEPRSIDGVRSLGQLDRRSTFEVVIAPEGRHFPDSTRRDGYWAAADLGRHENALVFLDPDNGFETRTQSGAKWVDHREVSLALRTLPASSAVVVYQHRPRRTWDDVLRELTVAITYAPFAAAAAESNLAFVILAREVETGRRVGAAAEAYCAGHPSAVRYVPMKGAM